ncbi:unnamed protein product [Microthlaspi erraticum]|uniref:Uncharacterized protein n=1 Tax=Microthlaspi erraticum TaxID=1685480 RepID=A0A6D2IKP2_9BRAS|nr:unnamed protein product [Microthlaspi erraticum]
MNHDPESTKGVAANQWLVQFQQTLWAWDVTTSPIVSLFSALDWEFAAIDALSRRFSPRRPLFKALRLMFKLPMMALSSCSSYSLSSLKKYLILDIFSSL